MAGDTADDESADAAGTGPLPRVCHNGHAVMEDYLSVCPRCGGQLPPATAAARAPSLAPRGSGTSVSKTGPFIVGGIVLALFALLLIKGAERGIAEDFGWVLLAAAVVVVLTGLLDAARRRR